MGRWRSWICTEFLPQRVMWGRPSPAKWMKSRLPQARQPARGFEAEISACSLVQTSKESKVRRSGEAPLAPSKIWSASDAAKHAPKFIAELRIPEVSQVSTIPRAESGKMH